MSFQIIEVHVCALVQCECGEFISLSDDRVETCPECPHRYQLRAQVLDVVEVSEEMSSLTPVSL